MPGRAKRRLRAAALLALPIWIGLCGVGIWWLWTRHGLVIPKQLGYSLALLFAGPSLVLFLIAGLLPDRLQLRCPRCGWSQG